MRLMVGLVCFGSGFGWLDLCGLCLVWLDFQVRYTCVKPVAAFKKIK